MFSGVLSRAVDTSNMNTNMSNRGGGGGGGGGSRGRGGGEEEEDEEGGLLSETVRAYVRSSTDSSFDRWRSLTLVVTWSVVTWSVVGSISHWPLDLFSSGNSARPIPGDVIRAEMSFTASVHFFVFPFTTSFSSHWPTRVLSRLPLIQVHAQSRSWNMYINYLKREMNSVTFFIWLKCLCS